MSCSARACSRELVSLMQVRKLIIFCAIGYMSIDLSPTGYRGEGIGVQWFFLGDWDQKWGHQSIR